jgi:chemotaxis protein CheD
MTSRSGLQLPGQASSYFDRHFQRQAWRLLPGEWQATGADEMIVTVLGSCVAVCLLDPEAAVGGMNHFMLPHLPAQAPEDPGLAGRYGFDAMNLLIEGTLQLGAQRPRLVAKAFGGGRVVDGLGDVGGQNAAFIRGFLRAEGIPLLAEDLGGDRPRKVCLFPATGQVLVKRLAGRDHETLLLRERAWLDELDPAPAASGAEPRR